MTIARPGRCGGSKAPGLSQGLRFVMVALAAALVVLLPGAAPTAARLAVSAIAVPRGVTREALLPVGWKRPSSPESYLVRAGGFVFLSGLVSRRGRDEVVVPGPVSTQVGTILDNARTLLRTAGVTTSDVVAARVFLSDNASYEAMN